MKYCVYLTTYDGNELPPFYIGSSSIHRIKKGYKGSVSSIEYKEVFRALLKKFPEKFRTTIISLCKTRKQALLREMEIQEKLKVVDSPLYINKCIAHVKYFGKQSKELKLHRSQKMKGNTFNKSKGKKWFKNEELGMSIMVLGTEVPVGFEPGRILDIEKMKKKCRKASLRINRNRTKEEKRLLYGSKTGFKWYKNDSLKTNYYGIPNTQPMGFIVGRNFSYGKHNAKNS